MKKRLFLLLPALILLTGCAVPILPSAAGDTAGGTYKQISQEEARQMMVLDDGHIVLDVRRPDEYEAGHIPGAVCLTNETIGPERPELLLDLDQVILVYCRSGNRSKQAARKLADMGYTNVYEFGGIMDWTGEVTSGPDPWPVEALSPVPTLCIEANGHTFYAALEDNASAEALVEKLSQEAITVDLHDYGDFEKVGPLPWSLPRSDESITTEPGDVILYQGSQITVYYDENTWNFTRLAHIGGATRDALLEVFGSGNVQVTFRIEWSE